MKARKVAYKNSREKHRKSLWIVVNELIKASLETKSGQKKDLSTANASNKDLKEEPKKGVRQKRYNKYILIHKFFKECQAAFDTLFLYYKAVNCF